MARLEDNGLKANPILADAGFSPGKNYRILEHLKPKVFITLHDQQVVQEKMNTTLCK